MNAIPRTSLALRGGLGSIAVGTPDGRLGVLRSPVPVEIVEVTASGSVWVGASIVVEIESMSNEAVLVTMLENWLPGVTGCWKTVLVGGWKIVDMLAEEFWLSVPDPELETPKVLFEGAEDPVEAVGMAEGEEVGPVGLAVEFPFPLLVGSGMDVEVVPVAVPVGASVDWGMVELLVWDTGLD